MKKRTIITVISALIAITLLIVISLIVCVILIWIGPNFSNEYVKVSNQTGGKPCNFTFKLIDTNDNPLQNVRISMDDSSGGRGGHTDKDGLWIYNPDGELLGIEVNRKLIYQNINLLELLAPTPGKKGKVITIKIKDLKYFKIEDSNIGSANSPIVE